MSVIFLHQLEAIFSWILAASWQASILALLVLLLQKALGARLNPRWRYALWLLVLVRLLLPALPESALSLFQFAPPPPAAIVTPVTEPLFVAATLPALPDENQTPIEPAYTFSIFTLLALIWLIGSITLFFVTWQVNRRFARQIANSPQINDPELLQLFAAAKSELGVTHLIRLIENSQVQSPAIMGLFRPTLLLPANVREKFDARELRFIFLHELAHLKRGDVIAQAVIALLQIVHWFNPILWFAFRRMRIDREPATDALVLSRTGEDEKESYGLMLIKLLEHFNQRHSLPTLVGILEDKDQFKRRFSLIAKFTRGAYGWSLLGILLIALLAIACLTKGKSDLRAAHIAQFTAKLQTVHIDLPAFTNVTLDDFYAAVISAEVKTDVSGERFAIKNASSETNSTRITLPAQKNISVYDAIQTACKTANLRMVIDENNLVRIEPLSNASAPAPPEPQQDYARVEVLAIELPESDYQAKRAEIDDAVQQGHYLAVQGTPHARVIARSYTSVTKLGKGSDLMTGPNNPSLMIECTPTRAQDKIHLTGQVTVNHMVRTESPGAPAHVDGKPIGDYPIDGMLTPASSQFQAIPKEGIVSPVTADGPGDNVPYHLFLFFKVWPQQEASTENATSTEKTEPTPTSTTAPSGSSGTAIPNGRTMQFEVKVVEIDAKKYAVATDAMNTAVQQGDVHFFDNKPGVDVLPPGQLTLSEGKRGSYSIGKILSYLDETESKDGKSSTAQANSVFVGPFVDFDWSKGGNSLSQSFQLTEPIDYKSAVKTDIPGVPNPLRIPEFGVHTFKDQWKLDLNKVHGTWMSNQQTNGELKLIAKQENPTIDDLIKAKTPSRIAIFITPQTVAATSVKLPPDPYPIPVPSPTPLYNAITGDQYDIAKTLLDKGADVYIMDMPEALAVCHNQIVKLLWDHGAHHCSELTYAISQGATVEKVKTMLKNGISVQPPEDKIISPLAVAAANGNLSVVTLLVEQKADPNWHGDISSPIFMPLRLAITNRWPDVFTYLIDQGAQIDPMMIIGAMASACADNPRHPGARKNALQIVQILIEHGALEQVPANMKGSILSQACVSVQDANLVRLILAHGYSPNDLTSYGSQGEIKVIDYVRRAFVGKDNWTPNPQLKPILTLLEAGEQPVH
jgi:bla regulator protein BlaR1